MSEASGRPPEPSGLGFCDRMRGLPDRSVVRGWPEREERRTERFLGFADVVLWAEAQG